MSCTQYWVTDNPILQLSGGKMKLSYLIYLLLKSSQIARATTGHRMVMMIEGTGTSVILYTGDLF